MPTTAPVIFPFNKDRFTVPEDEIPESGLVVLPDGTLLKLPVSNGIAGIPEVISSHRPKLSLLTRPTQKEIAALHEAAMANHLNFD